MKIADCFICWTPVGDKYPSGFRGKIRVFPAGTAHADMAPFAKCRGRVDARAHDSRREVREAYAVGVATSIVDDDGIAFAIVHQAMLAIDEYRSGCAPELLETRSQHSEEH